MCDAEYGSNSPADGFLESPDSFGCKLMLCQLMGTETITNQLRKLDGQGWLTAIDQTKDQSIGEREKSRREELEVVTVLTSYI